MKWKMKREKKIGEGEKGKDKNNKTNKINEKKMMKKFEAKY